MSFSRHLKKNLNSYFGPEQKVSLMSPIAKKISKTRKLKGLTQEELAELSKVNLRTIQRIENGENTPRSTTLKLICKVLNINFNELTSKKSFISPNNHLVSKIVNWFFLIMVNLVLMALIGYLTLDSSANLNSKIGGLLISIFIPLFIVNFTPHLNGLQRMLKFGLGYITYFILVIVMHGFPIGFTTMLFPCLAISLFILNFGSNFYSKFSRN